MQLLYLTESQLQNQLFMMDFVRLFPKKKKAVIVHDSFADSTIDTRFVSKRLSSLLSENMIHNMAFNAGQRNIVRQGKEGLEIRVELLEQFLSQTPVLILGPVLAEKKMLNPVQMLAAIRSALPIKELVFFPNNPRSPLTSKRNLIPNSSDAQSLKAIYEEEKGSIQMALDFAPAWICGLDNW